MLIRDHCHERKGGKAELYRERSQIVMQPDRASASLNWVTLVRIIPRWTKTAGTFYASLIQSLKWVAQRTWSQPDSSEGVDSWRLSPDHTPCSWAISHEVLPPSWHRIFLCSFRLASSGWESMWYDQYNSIALFLLSYLLCCKVSPPSNIMWDSMLVDQKSSDSECWLRPSGR